MTWPQIKQLNDMGFEIGNHSMNHRLRPSRAMALGLAALVVLAQAGVAHGSTDTETVRHRYAQLFTGGRSN